MAANQVIDYYDYWNNKEAERIEVFSQKVKDYSWQQYQQAHRRRLLRLHAGAKQRGRDRSSRVASGAEISQHRCVPRSIPIACASAWGCPVCRTPASGGRMARARFTACRIAWRPGANSRSWKTLPAPTSLGSGKIPAIRIMCNRAKTLSVLRQKLLGRADARLRHLAVLFPRPLQQRLSRRMVRRQRHHGRDQQSRLKYQASLTKTRRSTSSSSPP